MMGSCLRTWKAVLIILLLTATSAAAAPQLEVALGLAGRFVPERLTPVRITISGVGSSFSGSLLFTQRVGNPWRGEAESRVEIPLTLAGGTTLEYLLPIYDFAHPLRVFLLNEGGETLAEEELKLRSRHRDEAFPLGVGAFPLRFSEELVTIGPEELSRLWPAYEAVSSLWIGRITSGIPPDRWEGIAQWVLAGGTLVLFTGGDFYLLDTPLLRELLPIQRPHIEVGSGDLFYLQGDARSSTRTLLMHAGAPLLLARDYGAGTIFLVTMSAFDLERADLFAIKELIPPVHLVSFATPLADLLEETTLQRPGCPAATLLVLVSLISLSLIASRARTAKGTFILLLAASSLLSLSSGLYINRTKLVNDLYLLKTSLYVKASFGFHLDSYALFSRRDALAGVKVRGVMPVMEELPRSLQGRCYDIDWQAGEGLSLSLARGERRYLRGFGAEAPLLAILFDGDEEVTIENDLPGLLKEALLIVDGEAFPIGEVDVGVGRYYLEGGIPIREAGMQEPDLDALYNELSKEFALQEGIWLVAGREVESLERTGGMRLKVRDIGLYVVSVEGYE